MTDETKRKPFLDLSATQLIGGSLAAATAAALGSRLGVVGTIVGAALVSPLGSVVGVCVVGDTSSLVPDEPPPLRTSVTVVRDLPSSDCPVSSSVPVITSAVITKRIPAVAATPFQVTRLQIEGVASSTAASISWVSGCGSSRSVGRRATAPTFASRSRAPSISRARISSWVRRSDCV